MQLHPPCLSLLLALFFSTFLGAQTLPSGSGWSLHLGAGAVPTFTKGPKTVDVPPLSARLDYRIRPHWSVGLYAGYSATTSHTDYSSDGIYLPLRNDFYIGGLRTAFHARFHERLDCYGGAMLGYNLPVISQVGSEAPVSIPKGKPHYYRLPEARYFMSGFVGGNYALGKHLGLYGEIGFGVSLVQFGLRIQL